MANSSSRTIARWKSRTGRAAVALAGALGLVLAAASPGGALTNSPDTTWGTNGRVLAILRAGSRVYVGGTFTQALPPAKGTALPRTNLLAFDATTGAPDTAFLPNPNGTVSALAISTDGTTLYVGGTFTTVGGGKHLNLAAVDAVTGALRPGFAATASRSVEDLAATSTRLYVGGKFGTISDGTEHIRPYLGAVDAATGAFVSSFQPVLGDAGTGNTPIVRALDLSADGRVFASGDFLQVDGQSRNKVAAWDAATGALDQTFRPAASWNTDDITVVGSQVFVAIAGPGGRIRAMRSDTGATQWEVHTNGNMQAVAVLGNLVYGGGHFGGTASVAGLDRWKILAMDTATGAIDGFNPRIDSALGVWALSSDANHLYLGGDFTQIDGSYHPYYARYTS